MYNRGVEKRPVFTNTHNLLRAVDLLRFYQFVKPPLRYSKYLALSRQDKESFLQNLHNKEKLVEIVAYCFMKNHFHLLIKQLYVNGISQFMANVTNSYTKYFNTKQKRVGPLFQGIFKAVWVEDEEQLLHLSRYIHLNPVTNYSITVSELKYYQWSSYPVYIGEQTTDFVEKDIVTDSFTKKFSYEDFVLDQVAYARELKKIEHLTLE